MIIPIYPPSNQSGAPIEKVEWVMIELNGELIMPTQVAASSAEANDKNRRVELGSVVFDTDGTPTLIIGNHQLKGSSIILKEPFAVLRKRKLSVETENADPSSGDKTSASKIASHNGVQFEVAGIVKKKLKFDSYPKSIMR